MIEYIILLFLIVVFININAKISKGIRILGVIFIWTYLTLLFGLRYRVGVDTINYMSFYSFLPDLSSFKTINWNENKMEPGFILLCILCKNIINDFWFAQLIIAGLINGFISIFIYRQCKNPFIGFLMYFILAMFYFSTEILRESIAVGIFLLNFKNFEDGYWKKYYFYCFISILFHYSAIITFLFPLVRLLKINIWYIIACIIFICITPIFDTINNIISISSVTNRIEAYSIQAGEVNINFRFFFLIYLLIPALFVIIFSYKRNMNSYLMKFVLLHLLFCFGIFAIPIIFSRFTNYTLPFIIVSISNIVSSINYTKKIKTILLIVAISSQLLYYNNNFYRWIPYVSILNPRMIQEREDIWWLQFGQYK